MTARKAKAPTLRPVEAFYETTQTNERFKMKDTTAKANKQDNSLPTNQQARNIALKMVGDIMQTLVNLRLADKDWDGKNDGDADFALDLAHKELQCLQAAQTDKEHEFFTSWWRISAVVSLADNAFKRDCLFKSHLEALPEAFRVLGEMIEITEAA